MKQSILALLASFALLAHGEILVYEGFHPADYGNVFANGNVAAGDATFTAEHTVGIASAKWDKMNGTQIRIFGADFGLALPSVMTDAGFTPTGGAIGCNPSSNNSDMRAMYHTLASGALNASAGTTLYVRMLLNVDATAAGKLSATAAPAGNAGNYYGFGFTQADDGNSRLLTCKRAAFAFAVWKNSDNQCVLAFVHTTSGGTTATFHTLVDGITLGETYVCYAAIQVGAGADGAEIIQAGAMASGDFTGAASYAEPFEAELLSDTSYPTVMAVAGPYGSNKGYFRADEIVVGTALADILPDGGVFSVVATGAPTIGTEHFSTDWILVADNGVTADAGIVWSADASFATATTNTLGTGLAAGTRPATISGLAPDTTYWWKIYADNGRATAETTPDSFTTRGAPVLGALSATPGETNASFAVALAEAALTNTLSTSVSLFYGADGETWTEVPVGSSATATNWTTEVQGLDYGATYQWFVRAAATLPGGRVLSTDSAIASFTEFYSGEMYVSAGNAGAAVPYATPETAAPDIATAVALATDGATIHVMPGLYKISKDLALSKAISIVGASPDPSRVIVSNTVGANHLSGNQRVFTINHADALVANLTMQKGSVWGDWAVGGNFFIGTAGGMVSNCVVEAGNQVSGHGSGGGGQLEAGLVTHTVFRGNKCVASTQWGQNKAGVLFLKGAARAENCLLVDNPQSTAAVLVKQEGTSILRNCTIVDSALAETNDFCKSWSALNIASGATVQNVVIAGVTNTVDGAPCQPTGTVANFQNGALDASIEGTVFPADTVVGTAASFFRDAANGDYRPRKGGPLVGAGANYEGMAALDLGGAPRHVGARVDIGAFEAGASHTLLILQ